VALDLSRELVGQTTLGLDWGSFGSTGNAGEFGALANNPVAPTSSGWFTLQASNGDKLYLTSLRPVPEPTSPWLLGIGLLLVLPRRSAQNAASPH
jgi:hypothetical protein